MGYVRSGFTRLSDIDAEEGSHEQTDEEAEGGNAEAQDGHFKEPAAEAQSTGPDAGA
jgi:hypothetical protein